MTQKRTIERILNNIDYVLVYRKDNREGYTCYYFREPDGDQVRKTYMLKSNSLAKIVKDPLCIRYLNGKIELFNTPNDEDLRFEICKRANILSLNINDKLNEGYVCGIPSDEPLYSTTTIFDNKKITRCCADFECENKITTYRSKLERGEGLFCCKSHARKNQNMDRVQNTCLFCGITYTSIWQDDHCSYECEKAWFEREKLKQPH